MVSLKVITSNFEVYQTPMGVLPQTTLRGALQGSMPNCNGASLWVGTPIIQQVMESIQLNGHGSSMLLSNKYWRNPVKCFGNRVSVDSESTMLSENTSHDDLRNRGSFEETPTWNVSLFGNGMLSHRARSTKTTVEDLIRTNVQNRGSISLTGKKLVKEQLPIV